MERLKKFASSYSKLNRNARLMILSNALGSLGWGAYGAVWQLYFKASGYKGAWIGAYSFLSGVTMTLFAIPAGFFVDRAARKPIVFLSYGIEVASICMILASMSKPILLVSAITGGMGWAFSAPSWNALFAESFEEVGLEIGYSLNSFVSAIFMSLGNLLAWFPEILARKGLGYFSSYRLFLSTIALMQIASILPILLVSERFKPSPARRIFHLKSWEVAIRFSVTGALVGFGAGLSIHLIGYYFSSKFGVESGPIGTLFALESFISAPSFLMAAQLSSKIGTVMGAVIPQLASIPLLALIPSASSFTSACLLYVPRTIFMNMSNPLVQALMMRLTPEEERGTITSISQITWNLPNSAAKQIGGILMDRISLDLPLYLTSILYGVHASLFYLLFRKYEEMLENAKAETA